MKIAVMGSGGVGGYFGGRLAQGDNDVHFIARGAHLEALRRTGLRVKSALGDFSVTNVSATDDANTVGKVDAVLFTVKSQDTRAAAEQIRPLLGADTPVVSLQNGVDNEDVLQDVLGGGHVLGGVAYIEAVISAGGEITHRSPFARLSFGELDGRASERATRLLEAFRAAGVEAELSSNIRRVVWTKWLFICAFSGVTALTREPIGRVLADEDTAALYRGAMEEIAALARARGVELPDDIVQERLEFSRTSLDPAMRSSLQQDLLTGRALELDALNGYARELGDKLGVDTPVNDFVYAALKLHKNGSGGGASGAYTAPTPP